MVAQLLSTKGIIDKFGENSIKPIRLISLVINQVTMLCFAFLGFPYLSGSIYFRNCRAELSGKFHLVFKFVTSSNYSFVIVILVPQHSRAKPPIVLCRCNISKHSLLRHTPHVLKSTLPLRRNSQINWQLNLWELSTPCLIILTHFLT